MPFLIRFSVSFQQLNVKGEATIELLPKVDEYLSLIMTLIFAFGIAFQLPVILTLLGQAGIIDQAFLQSQTALCDRPDHRGRGDPDAARPDFDVSLVLPMALLYEGAVFAVGLIEKNAPLRSPMQMGKSAANAILRSDAHVKSTLRFGLETAVFAST